MTNAHRAAVTAAVLALSAATTAVAYASEQPPISAAGTLTYTSSVFNSVREDGPNTVINLTSNVTYTGTLQGTSTLTGDLRLHSDGTANFHDIEVFTGSVNGVPGTVTFELNGSTNRDGIVSATDTVISATGELSGLDGVLKEIATVPNPSIGPVGNYTGQLEQATG
jgi:hypothetical protein